LHGKTSLRTALFRSAAVTEAPKIVENTATSPLKATPSYSTGYSSKTVNYKSNPFLFSILDTPGHIECHEEVFSALKITDGAILVVDCIDGPRLQTHLILKQLLKEQVRPVLFINMLDRAILEEKLSQDELYNKFDQVIKVLNSIISAADPTVLESFQFDPLKGNVLFGSAKNGWTFNLGQFAKTYAQKRNISDYSKVLQRLWGDQFYDAEKKQFISKNLSPTGVSLPRFFCKVILDPIYKIIQRVNATPQDYKSLIPESNIEMSIDEENLTGLELAHSFLPKFSSGSLVETVIEHLPSPTTAQKYRSKQLYPKEDDILVSMSDCDANGPALVFISRNLLSPDQTSFNMIARVFSGTIRPGDKLFARGIEQGSFYKRDAEKYNTTTLRRILTLSGDLVECAVSGNIVILEGLELIPNITSFTLSSVATAHSIPTMISCLAPRLRIIIKADKMDSLVPALRKLHHVDVRTKVSNNEDWLLDGVAFECHGEFHAEAMLDRLRTISKELLFTTDYHCPLRESVSEISSKMSVTVTPNKHNRFWMKLEPLGDTITKKTDALDGTEKFASIAEYLKELGLDQHTANSTWFVGPEGAENEWNSNIFTNYTKNVDSIHEERIQKLLRVGFLFATREGVLCSEPLRGIKANLYEANTYSRTGYSSIPNAIQRVMKAAQLRAKPILLEPIFKMEIKINLNHSEKAREVLTKRRAFNLREEKCGKDMIFLHGYLPALGSLGLMAELSLECKQIVYPQLVFDDWRVIEGDPLAEGSLANKIMMQIRKRKDLPASIPTPEDYEDKGYDYHNY
jgi:elongation factor 2